MIETCRITMLPTMLCECGTWSRKFRDEHGGSMCDKSVLRRMFGAQNEVERDLRKLHNGELRKLRSPQTTIRMCKTCIMIGT
jgi:hypothetical protein